MGTVYKYTPQRGGVAILENLQLKITPPIEFNDPFEFTPNVICTNPRARASAIIRNKEHLRTLYTMMKEDGQFTGNFQQFKAFIAPRRAEISKVMSKGVPHGAAIVWKELLNKASLVWGVLCLSKRRDSILMWGHYCESHQGIVIGFDDSNEIFRELRPVKYVRERVIYDATWNETDAKVTAFEDEIAFSKNEDWSYEQELRQLFKLASLIRKSIADRPDGYFLPLNPNSILSVTLGARCPQETTRTIEKALQQPCFSHVQLEAAALHETKFAMEFLARTSNRIS